MPLFILLLLAFAAYGQQQKRIAIINTVDDEEPPIKHSELNHLTNKLREIAVKTLPQESYAVMTTESIVAFLGSQERAQKECKEATCLAELGRKVNADYVAQARIGRFGKNLTINAELYGSKSGSLIGLFTGVSKDIFGLLSVLDKEAPGMFGKMPGVSGSSRKSFTDVRDGKEYRIVVIGKQTWMAENLNYNASGSKCYGEGGKVYNEKTKKTDITLSKAQIQANCDKYGRLYDWATAMKACPKGWHLPSDKDWNALMKFVNPNCSDNEDCAGAGTKLKATSGWNSYKGKSGNGTDEFGFSALPGGFGGSVGDFLFVGIDGDWWGADEGNSEFASRRYVNVYSEDVLWGGSDKYNLLSVRCLKD